MSETDFFAVVERHPRVMVGVGLRALDRYSAGNRRSSPTSTVGVLAAPDIDVEWLLEACGRALGSLSDVGTLSPAIVDEALGSPGISSVEHGTPADVRVSRFIYELELNARHLFVDIGTGDGPWARRAAGLVDRVLLVVRPDTGADIMDRLQRFAHRVPSVPLTLVVAHHSQKTPTGTHRLKEFFGATGVVHIVHGDQSEAERLGRIALGAGNALILSGGGARGFAHVGVYRALVNLGFDIDMVGGTSMGGLMGAGIADRMTPDEMVKWAAEHFPGSIDYTVPIVSMARGARIAKSAERMFGNRHIEDLKLPFFAIATDLTTSREIPIDSGPVATALRATSSIPGLLPPVPVNGSLLVDGGILNNLPVDVARERSPNGLIVAVDVAPRQGPSAHADYGLSVSAASALSASLRGSRRYPRLPAVLMRTMIAASMRKRDEHVRDGIADLYLSLDLRGVSMLDFDDPASVADRGYESAVSQIESWLTER